MRALDHDFTVLTMFNEAGASRPIPPSRAIARAIANCKAYPERNSVAVPISPASGLAGAWEIRCGRENIIVADEDLVEAERRRRGANGRLRYASAGDAGVRSRGDDRSERWFVTPELASVAGKR